MTELKARDIKDIILLVSVIAPIVFGFVFLFQLLDMGVFFLIYMAFIFAGTKRGDGSESEQKE